MYELAERVHVLRKRREDIDMIPRNPCQNSNVRVIPQELAAQVQRRSEILITFKDGVFGSIRKPHHAFESLYLRANHVIGFDAETLQHIENHGRGGCLAV